jgi:hypothetical protein
VSDVTDTVPPRVIHQNPFRIYPFIAEEQLLSVAEEESSIENGLDLPSISVTFSEPVLHMMANDFIVNQSPATFVNGTGRGPYLFSGFEIPKPGPVNVTLLQGNISYTNGNQFEGSSWNYTMVDPDKNNDNDGASDKLEVDFFRTNPLVSDTNGDYIPDGVEVSFPCLEPLTNDAIVMDIAHNVVNETGSDSDNDGKTDVEEFFSQTDPCSKTQLTDVDTVVTGILSERASLDSLLSQPFALVIKRTGGIAGGDSSISYDSFTKRAISIVNGKEISRQISNADEDMTKQILNNSGFFDANNNFYPPAPNSIDYQEFTLIATIDGNLQAIYWTDASEAVPEPIQNLPYIISYALGTGSIF